MLIDYLIFSFTEIAGCINLYSFCSCTIYFFVFCFFLTLIDTVQIPRGKQIFYQNPHLDIPKEISYVSAYTGIIYILSCLFSFFLYCTYLVLLRIPNYSIVNFPQALDGQLRTFSNFVSNLQRNSIVQTFY
jgi:hypothetical protein